MERRGHGESVEHPSYGDGARPGDRELLPDNNRGVRALFGIWRGDPDRSPTGGRGRTPEATRAASSSTARATAAAPTAAIRDRVPTSVALT